MEPKLEDLELVHESIGHPSERWVWRIKESHLPHHPHEPARQYKDGDWIWFWMGREHRWDGPAMLWMGRYYYFIHDQKLSREEWERHPQRLEWLKTKLGSL